MSRHAEEKTERSSVNARIKKWIAGVSAAALGAGLLVVAGFGVNSALAGAPAPGVSVAQSGTYLAGEDLSLNLTFTSAGAAAGDEYNLSAGVVMPQGITVVDSGTLGASVVHTGRALPLDPVSPAARVQLPGNYSMSEAQCAALGLEPWTPDQASGKCVVPDGMQYLVFQNISDLPEGASATHSVTLRPDALVFPVGSRVELDVTAFTSEDVSYIPVFPGSTGVADDSGKTSAPGFPAAPNRTTSVLVNALRLEKSEPSPESELLRGVHANSTTYTLRVWHTGEGDIDDVTVTDFIPAGLEYLGLGSAVDPDRTTNANGTQGLVEYPGAPRLDSTPAPAGSTYAGTGVIDASRNAANMGEETVTTRVATAADAAAHPGVVAGDVYTVVSWNIGELLKTGLASYSILDPVAQTYDAMPGTPGFFEIRYRAAVPLFENTVDFDGNGNQPTADGGRHQIANLDNNRGASTRHGSVQTTPGFGDDGDAKSYTNVATAAGVYNGEVADEADRILTDTDTETIDAVDVRLLKSVDYEEFTQGGLATYTLDIHTSEYTSADLGAGGSGAIRPNRLVDDLGDGICPVFPAGVAVTPGASTAGTDIPRLVIGNPNPGGSVGPDLTAADWTAALGSSLASACGFPSSRTGAALTGTPGATTLTGIAYDPTSGHFYLDLNTAALAANSQQVITYTALQNTVYSEGGGVPGATTSGDTIVNTAELMMTTQSIPALDNVESASGAEADGTWRAWDDSDATLQASLSELNKWVLKREAGVPARNVVMNVDDDDWVKTPEENTPFAVGDQVWYKIKVTPPSGADVRNAKLTDFLPEGVSFDSTTMNGSTKRLEDMWIVPSGDWGAAGENLPWIGTCTAANAPIPSDIVGTPGDNNFTRWLYTFVPNPTVSGNVLTFELGQNCGLGGTDRFMPLAAPLEVYLKVSVKNPAAFAEVDLPQNLAKYQQNNVDGEIFFLRDMAEIEVDGSPRLLKGIRSNTNADSPSRPAVLPGGNLFNTNVDGTPTSETVVQGDEVTFRLDVSAPRTGTTNYQVWDALPVGIKAADVKPGSYTAADVNQVWVPIAAPNPGHPGFWEVAETPVPATSGATTNWTADVYDYDPAFNAGAGGYPGAPADVNDHLRDEIKDAERSIVVWSYSAPVLGSIAEDDSVDPVIPAAFRGITLGYTVVVPDGTTGSAAAELTQRYQNDASIVQFAYQGNSSTPGNAVNNEVIVNGTENLADERHPAPGSGVFELDDEDNTTSDPSQVYVLGTGIDKVLVETEVKPTGSNPADANNTSNLGPAPAARPDDAIVQGEHATFQYSVVIPGNTTVKDAKLSDDGKLRWTGSPSTPSSREVDYNFVDGSAVFEVRDKDGAVIPGFVWTGFDRVGATGGAERPGTLVFPATYTNTGADPLTFVVQIKVWVEDRDETDNTYNPDFPHSKTLTNTARLEFTNPNYDPGLPPGPDNRQKIEADDDANVTYIEPLPTLSKTVVGTPGGADGLVTFELTAGSTAGLPALYDAVVYDCLPAGFAEPAAAPGWNFTTANGTAQVSALAGGKCRVDGTGADQRVIPDAAGTGTLIEWTDIGRLDAGSPSTLLFTAKLDPAAGGGASYINRAHIVGYTLPGTIGGESTADRRGDRATGAERDVTLTRATLAKTVSPAYAPVGGTVRYTLTTTIPANANFWDAQLVDTLPPGFSYAGNPTVSFVGGPAVTNDLHVSGQTVTWPATAGPPSAGSRIDIPFDTVSRTIVISFDARVTDSVAASPTAANRTNRATFFWNMSDGVDSTRTNTDEATAIITVQHPRVGLVKKVDARTASPVNQDAMTLNPDGTFRYAITVNNTGTGAVGSANRTPAHHVSMQDVVPAGVIVDPASISPVPTNLAAISTALSTGTGATIQWQDFGPLYPLADSNGTTRLNSMVFSYNGSFVGAANLTDATKTNTATVTEYFSWDPSNEGRRYVPGAGGVPAATDTAQVTPVFPNVALLKQVSPDNPANPAIDVAYVDTPFAWTLRATNNGAGHTQNIEIQDELPENWSYDGDPSRAPQIRLNGGAWVTLAAPTGTTNLVWSEASVRAALENGGVIAAGSPVIPGKVGSNASSYLEIRFSTIPQTGALTDAGVTTDAGVAVPHTNTLTAVAKDTRGDTGRQGVPSYSPGSSPANGYIHSADLKLVKDAVGGTTGNAPAGHPLHGVPADQWVIGQSLEAGVYTQPQWRITVDNHGPNASYGPFEITDTLDLPAGVTTTGWAAQYFAPGATTGTPISLSTSGSGTTADPYRFTVGGNTTSLNAAGTDRIVLTANVNITTAADPGAKPANDASVLGRTYEAPSKLPNDGTNPNPNEDDAERTLTESADLAVVKTMTNAGGTVNAGGTINWSIQPVNNGPSVSRNSAANPITITDTIPTGVSGVADPSNATWIATLNGAAWPVGTTATAGDTITFTLDPAISSLGIGGAGVHAPITMSGTVDAAWTPTSGPAGNGSIVNVAVITPGSTPDPVTPNNTDDAPANPAFDATLGITKVRVIWDTTANAWVPAATLSPVPPVNAGDQVSYLVTVSNSGLAVARGVQVVDEHPTTLFNATWVTHAATGDPTGTAVWTRADHAAPNTHWDVFSLTGNLPVGQSRAFVVTYDTAPTLPANVTNWVEASSEDNPSKPRDDEPFDSDRLSMLSIEKTHTVPAAGAAALAGQAVTYRMVITNDGPSDSLGVISLSDALPTKFSFVPGSATVDGVGGEASQPTVTGDPNAGGQTLTWAALRDATGTLPATAPNNTIVVTFQALVAADHPEQNGVQNAATVTGPDNSDTDRDPVDIDTEATMTIVKTTTNPADPGPWHAGTDVEYTLTVTNNGPSAAPAQVVDTLPAGLTLVSMSGTDWTCTATPGTQSGSCTYDGLHPVGAAAATEITVVAHIASDLPTATLTNPFVNEAVLTWTDSRQFPDPTQDPRKDDDDASIIVTAQADLGLVKTAVDPADDVTEVTSAVAGEQARYRIDVTNYGPSDAAPDLVVTDTLPLGVSYVGPAGDTASNWSIVASAYNPAVQQTVTFTRTAGGSNVGLPMVGTSATPAPVILFDVLLDPSLQPTDPAAAPPVTPLVNTATVTSGTPEPAVDPHPNTDTAPLDVARSADLAVVKSHPTDLNGQLHVGDPLDYTIQVTNNGPSISSGFTVTDTVPAGIEVTSTTGPVTGTAWTIDSITLVDPLDPTGGAIVVATYAGTLGVTAGIDTEADPLIISTLIHENARGTVPNHVEITSANEPDPDTSNNEWSDPLDVTPVVKLVVEKTAVGQFQVGKVGTYRITVENQGPHDDPGPITVTDVLPNGLAYHSSPSLPAGVSMAVSGKTVTWTLTGGLAVGDTAELTLKVNVLQAAYPQVTNTVVIDSPADLTPDSVLSDDATVPVKALDPLSITGASAVGYLAMLAALLMLGGAVAAAARGRREVRGVRAD